ncbi:MAG: aminotransferase class I/II-fold pyridoxal phosphate-dependent enzyme [Bacteroidetes bacterium]|jgi:cystathionine beta-lyase/cystathionine gamma-synthase|nr:aminotransferase class I/II-fold pyridoxal phosphate-dependent enzyme [Bacteroidota bacterium]
MAKKKTITQTRPLSLSTRSIHGKKLFAYQGPVALPIYQTSTYRFASSDDAVRFAKGDPSVYVYTRYHNPTVRDVEETIALMEGADEAVLFSSGMAAITTAILSVTHAGDEIISTPALYGGTYRWFRDELPKLQVGVTWIDPRRLSDLPALVSPRTRIVYLETPTNPTLGLVDIEEVVRQTRIAEKKAGHRILVMIDNTFASILNQKPFELGVDVVTESATKYLGGHSDIVAGVIVGSSSFVKTVRGLAKHHGGCLDPFAAYLLGRSLKTFELRVQRQNVNAFALAAALEKHPRVKRVLYPGLTSHPQHALALKQMSGYGGMVTIEVKPSKRLSPVEAAAKVADNLRVAVNAMSLGGVETLVSIPVYSSHIFMDDAELARHGVAPGMIRISVGVEAVDDLIADFDQALRTI